MKRLGDVADGSMRGVTLTSCLDASQIFTTYIKLCLNAGSVRSKGWECDWACRHAELENAESGHGSPGPSGHGVTPFLPSRHVSRSMMTADIGW